MGGIDAVAWGDSYKKGSGLNAWDDIFLFRVEWDAWVSGGEMCMGHLGLGSR